MLLMMMTFWRSGENLNPSTFPSVFESCWRDVPSAFMLHTSPPLMNAMVSSSSHVGSVSFLALVVSCLRCVPSAFITQTTWWPLFCLTL